MCAPRNAVRMLAVLGLLLPAAAIAQPHGDQPARAHHAASDSTQFLPAWMHAWFELGGDWLAAPHFMRGAYESGQAFGLGLSARPRHRLEVRAALDFQTLQTQTTNVAYFLYGYDATGHALVDTVNYQAVGRAWTGTLRPEVGFMPVRDVWLTAGLGGGYMNGGFQDGFGSISGSSAGLPVAMSNGWGWLWTAAARWDIEPDPMLPLGFDVRTTGMRRGPDFVRTWSIRVTYRVPESLRRPH